jgi:hypothetical protein
MKWFINGIVTKICNHLQPDEVAVYSLLQTAPSGLSGSENRQCWGQSRSLPNQAAWHALAAASRARALTARPPGASIYLRTLTKRVQTRRLAGAWRWCS